MTATSANRRAAREASLRLADLGDRKYVRPRDHVPPDVRAVARGGRRRRRRGRRGSGVARGGRRLRELFGYDTKSHVAVSVLWGSATSNATVSTLSDSMVAACPDNENDLRKEAVPDLSPMYRQTSAYRLDRSATPPIRRGHRCPSQPSLPPDIGSPGPTLREGSGGLPEAVACTNGCSRASMSGLVPARARTQNERVRKLWSRFTIIPSWLSFPLMLLGLAAPVIAIFNRDWYSLVLALVLATAYGIFIKSRGYKSRVLERTPDRIVVETLRQRRSPVYRPLSRRAWILIAIGWVAIFVAIAFLPDDQAVGADFLLIIVTLIWVAYRLGRRRGSRLVSPDASPDVGPPDAASSGLAE
jgi:hypothetical protein